MKSSPQYQRKDIRISSQNLTLHGIASQNQNQNSITACGACGCYNITEQMKTRLTSQISL
jgi:hypothetical protein